jgi:hypothetical protein
VRAGQPTGSGIRLRVYGVRLATVPADEGFQLVTDEQGRLVPTGEKYRIPRAAAAPAGSASEHWSDGGDGGDCECVDPDHVDGCIHAFEEAGSSLKAVSDHC